MIIEFFDNELEWNETAFKPTTVSKVFAEVVPVDGKDVLDVGCGIGAIGIEFSKRGANSVTGLDISEEHIRLSNLNIERNNVNNMSVIQSDLYDQLDPDQQKFDIIASDVSGIDEPVAEVTRWFPEGIPSHSWKYICQAIIHSKKFLRDGGEFYFTYVTWSDQERIHYWLNRIYPNKWEIVHEKLIPFSPELNENHLLAAKYSPITQKGSRKLWHLWIVKCQK